MFKNRIDQNQKDIIEVFRNKGAGVHVMHTVKSGFPDLVVCYRGVILLVEVKTPNGTFTASQQKWLAENGEYTNVVRTNADAKKLLDEIDEYLKHNESPCSYLLS